MDSVLPIGHSHGCITIIGGFEVFQEEVVKKKIADLEQKKQKFINGERVDNNFESVDDYDRHIQTRKSYKNYQCRCRCGKVYFLPERYFLGKKRRYCGDNCGIKQEHERKRIASYPRVKDESYDINYLYTTHESLEILECIDENYEGAVRVHNKRTKDGGEVKVYKLYRCRCYLCGKEHKFKSSDFEIKTRKFGPRAKDGYYCDAYCNCHKISSFQWRTIKILREHNVAHRVEVEFQDLYGVGKKNLLRYDFAVLGSGNSIKCLIECQGEQHSKPVDEFGGVSQYESQVENDKLKRVYAESHNIPLFEIKYTCNTYEKEMKFLKTAGII
ncbi:hypothetical protein [Bacillus cereus group sp. TH150LC]|uniref:hypothetical protein n=1 Tax=Bacillus cereus group sp. TH150LC TaxID=3018061 RepID=UPI0022E788D8|nr:hypothetical protein [Bacillus cereus group sp. TH150LC]MDA1657933.1 hypothetical protein [Bacillus cereus group sp. TH150LC]